MDTQLIHQVGVCVQNKSISFIPQKEKYIQHLTMLTIKRGFFNKKSTVFNTDRAPIAQTLERPLRPREVMPSNLVFSVPKPFHTAA